MASPTRRAWGWKLCAARSRGTRRQSVLLSGLASAGFFLLSVMHHPRLNKLVFVKRSPAYRQKLEPLRAQLAAQSADTLTPTTDADARTLSETPPSSTGTRRVLCA